MALSDPSFWLTAVSLGLNGALGALAWHQHWGLKAWAAKRFRELEDQSDADRKYNAHVEQRLSRQNGLLWKIGPPVVASEGPPRKENL